MLLLLMLLLLLLLLELLLHLQDVRRFVLGSCEVRLLLMRLLLLLLLLQLRLMVLLLDPQLVCRRLLLLAGCMLLQFRLLGSRCGSCCWW